MALFAHRKQQVGQLEVLGGVALYSTHRARSSSVAHGRDVIHFIDNIGALFGLSKGHYTARSTVPASCMCSMRRRPLSMLTYGSSMLPRRAEANIAVRRSPVEG